MIVAINPSQTQTRQREVILRVVMCNFALAVLELGIGLAGYSKLILVDGIFAFVNGMMLLLMWPGHEIENRECDDRHPYGYGKILFVIAFVVGILFLVVSIYMYSYALNSMVWDELHLSYSAALMVGVISLAGNIAMYKFLKHEGSLQPHGVLTWNAFNNLIAAFAAFMIIIFTVLSSVGLVVMERVGVIVMSAIMLGLSLRILFKSSAGIMDRAPSRQIMECIRASAEKVQGVGRIIEIKARHVGTYMHVDLSFVPEKDATLREANEVAHRVEINVARAIPFMGKEINAVVV